MFRIFLQNYIVVSVTVITKKRNTAATSKTATMNVCSVSWIIYAAEIWIVTGCPNSDILSPSRVAKARNQLKLLGRFKNFMRCILNCSKTLWDVFWTVASIRIDKLFTKQIITMFLPTTTKQISETVLASQMALVSSVSDKSDGNLALHAPKRHS